MKYTKISPLGPREGKGTFDTFYDTKKYPKGQSQAEEANDAVIVDFVKDDDGIVYFEFYNTKAPEIKKYHQLEIQHFPFGVDVFDDTSAINIATSMF